MKYSATELHLYSLPFLLLLFVLFVFILLCFACTYVHHMHAVPSEARGEHQLPDLELQMVVNLHVGAGNQTRVL